MERSSVLILKYLRQEISIAEQKELDLWLNESAYNREVFLELTDSDKLAVWLKEQEHFDEDQAWTGISDRIGGNPAARRWWRYSAVAALLLLIAGGGIYLWNKKETASVQIAEAKPQPDIAPAMDKAVLTLADGTIIELDSAAGGELSRQGTVRIMKSNNGQLTYVASENKPEKPGELFYNTIRTPRGGKYQVVLPDGSQVWLNAASSLRFPASFESGARDVELEGEGYFEIVQNSAAPFHVTANGVKVLVLGTSFNINSYADEYDIKTTLLEGKVKVEEGNEVSVLRPGQQAFCSRIDRKMMVRAANTEEVIAWKKGYFSFDKADVHAVMRQLSRWYDVDVVYTDNIPVRRFTGGMQRSLSLAKVLEILKSNDVKFKINDRKITLL